MPLVFSLILLSYSLTPLSNFVFNWAMFQPQFVALLQMITSYGLTILIILGNSIIFHFIYYKKNIFAFEIILLALVLGFSLLVPSPIASNNENAETIKVALVQANIVDSWHDRVNNPGKSLAIYERLSEDAQKDNPDIIIWPEYAVPDDLSKNKGLSDKIIKLSDELNIPLLIGSLEWLNGTSWGERHKHDIALLIEPDKEKMQKYISVKPLPLERPTKPGNNLATVSFQDKTIGIVLCFEETQRSMFREYKKRNVSMIFALSNDVHFSQSRLGLEIAGLYPRLYAAEFGIPLARATNTGLTQIIDPRGNVTMKLPANEQQILIAEVGFS